MKRKLIIGGAVVLVAALIVTAIVVGQNNTENEAATSNQDMQASSQIPGDGSGQTFLPTTGISFIATLSQENGEQQGGTATLESDGKETVRFTASSGEKSVATIYTKDWYYVCNEGETCIKYSASNAGFNPDVYTYSEVEAAEFSKQAKVTTGESCPAGTCTAWEFSKDGITSKIYAESTSKQISQVITSGNGQSSKIVYEYKPVVIEIPANAVEQSGPPTAPSAPAN